MAKILVNQWPKFWLINGQNFSKQCSGLWLINGQNFSKQCSGLWLINGQNFGESMFRALVNQWPKFW